MMSEIEEPLTLQVDAIDFAAGHYLPGHEKGCGSPHGHNYIVENLTIDFEVERMDDMGVVIDFGVVKGYFKREWNHRNVVPQEHLEAWQRLYEELGLEDNLKPVLLTSVEAFAVIIKRDLAKLAHVDPCDVHFTIYETGGPELPGMGATV